MKSILIHTHFHRRKTGVTRSIENILPYFNKDFDTYVYGYNIDGNKITKSKLKSFFKSNTPVTIHCHRNNELIKILWYRFLGAKFKLVATRHAESKPSSVTKFLLKKADFVITLIKSMSINLNIENSLVGHGVRVKQFLPNPEMTLQNIQQKNIMLNVGRVRERKGQLTLLKASKVLQEYKDWALVIVGKVDNLKFLKELKEIAEEYKITNQVYFIDETRDIIPYYQSAKIVVAPSYSEGFSLVTAEAMSCGCTTIATKNVGVHSELISNSKNGYLFESGNFKQLSSIILGIISGKLPYLGNEAREEIVKNWSAKKEAEKLIKIYKSKIKY